LRPVIIFCTLVAILASMFQLSRLAERWHYVVPARPGELLYIATFDDAGDDWEQSTGRLSSQVIDGVLRLSVDNIGDGIYSAASPYFRDFDMQVTVRAVEDPPDSGYGVIFRQLDRRNYYVFFISGDGFYRVARVVENQSRDLSAWHRTPLIHQGIGITNNVRVVGNDDRFQFYINEEPIELCIPDDPDALSTPLPTGECLGGSWRVTLVDDSIPFGRLGVAAQIDPIAQQAGLVVEFDRVIVYGPQPTGERES
jgi:hypothetical protein